MHSIIKSPVVWMVERSNATLNHCLRIVVIVVGTAAAAAAAVELLSLFSVSASFYNT